MISDFDLLSQKISQLAELAQALRRENADLRISMATISADNASLTARMNAAHERVTRLLEQMPATALGTDAEDDEEEAA
jgi:FtsZ-binding cell division protein ZapB